MTPQTWSSDPIVLLETALTPVVRDTALALLDCLGPLPEAEQIKLSALLKHASTTIDDVQRNQMADMSITLPGPDASAARQLQAHIEKLRRSLPDLRTETDRAALVKMLKDTLSPSVDSVLDAFRAAFIGAVLKRQALHKEAAEHAQREIRDISRQIFFISINASVEAARAGEFGKGFGVISREIRDLAQRADASLRDLTGATDPSRAAADSPLQKPATASIPPGTVGV